MTSSRNFLLGYLSAGEATSDDGTHRTKGYAAIAKADAERRKYLESYAEEWRRESRSHRAKMQFAAYRKGKVPA
jgi:hypothetical protein